MTRKLVALVGELAIIAGFLLGGYLIYQAWFSNIPAQQRAVEISNQVVEIYEELETISLSDRISLPQESFSALGLLYIPALGNDVWGVPILDDVSDRALASGVGHYSSTALPGSEGNFAVAGHRATNGEPFARFERLKSGDLVYVRTQQGYFTYRLIADQKIQDSETWVLDSPPEGLDTQASSLITLTTCDPRWNSFQRWARWGELIAFSKDRPEELKR